MLNLTHTLTPDERASFRGMPRRKIWTPDQYLYRIITPGQNYVMGKYWFGKKAILNLRQTADRLSKSPKEVARSRFAVMEEWNKSLSQVVVIQLRQMSYAWVGHIRYQPINENNPDVLLMGGMEQVLVPNLHHELTHTVQQGGNGADSFDPKYARIVFYGELPKNGRNASWKDIPGLS